MSDETSQADCTCEFPYPVGVWDGHHPNCALEQPSDAWCNCQAAPGTPTYPGPWHPKGDSVGCLKWGGSASVLRGEGQALADRLSRFGSSGYIRVRRGEGQ